jgi:hypothetical protein
MKLKKVSISVVVHEEEAQVVSRMMEKSMVAQEGIFTLECGHIEELTDDELEEVQSQVPSDLLDNE